jgi:5-methylcytosine-specific restriction endonuclease McrA
MIESGEMSLGVAAELSRFIRKDKPDEATQNRLIEQIKGKSRRDTDLILARESKEPAKLKNESLRRADTRTQRLSLNVTDELVKKLERLRGLLGHKNVSTYENLLDVATDELLKRLDPEIKVVKEKTKRTTTFAADVKRRKAIPVTVRRKIWGNARGRCEKCGGTHALEVDHRIPLAKAGSDDQENLRLLCRSCNQREAIIKIGRRQMNLFLD